MELTPMLLNQATDQPMDKSTAQPNLYFFRRRYCTDYIYFSVWSGSCSLSQSSGNYRTLAPIYLNSLEDFQ